MSKNQLTSKLDSENQRIIEEWMKRNNSGRVIVGQNNSGTSSQSKMQNERQSYPIIVSVTKNNENNKKFNKSHFSNEKLKAKRNSTQPNAIKTKIARWSSPAISIKIESVAPKSEKKESHIQSESSTVLKNDLKPVQRSEYLHDKLPAPNLKKICVPTNKGTKNGKNHTINKKNTANLQIKNDQDVYSSVKDNYKHLLTPKHWSVTEFENDSIKECIIFSKPHVINENEKLITVIQRSLVIDKGGTIHYSVCGMPVNVKGTILPDILDSIKKLLSILHIFDKMQVCKGLGDDLLIVKTDSIVQDICKNWRHADCKLVLVKADHCQTCLDTRNILLEKEMLFKSELLLQCEEIEIKQEQN